MDYFIITNPDCRTDLTTILSNKSVNYNDMFHIITDNEAHLLASKDSRLEVGINSVVIWRGDDSTRIPIEDITKLYWGGSISEERATPN